MPVDVLNHVRRSHFDRYRLERRAQASASADSRRIAAAAAPDDEASMQSSRQKSEELRAGLVAGFLCGFLPALLFAAAHAVLIVPIWGRMISGIALAALAGTAAGWAWAENYPANLQLLAPKAALAGAQFGALLWLLVTPVTAADALLRVVGIAPRLELVAVAVAVVLAISSGAFLGRIRTRTRRGMIAGAAATLALTIAMAGPVSVGRSARAFAIFVAVLPSAVLGGSVLAILAAAIYRQRIQTISNTHVNGG